jgi:hypothetical protein
MEASNESLDLLREWPALLEEVKAVCARQQCFLDRQEERAFHDQAGGDWEAGDEMVDTINHVIGLNRDRLIAILTDWTPPAELATLSEIAQSAIAMLEGHPQFQGWGPRVAVQAVVGQLRWELKNSAPSAT